MALSRYGQNLSYIDNTTVYSGDEIARSHALTDQASGALSAQLPGVRSGWNVSIGTGLSVNVAAGEGIAQHATYGAVALRSTGTLTATVPASQTGYIHALVEEDASPGGNRSVETMTPKFVFSDMNVLANAVCLAYVVSSGVAITTVYDRRRIVSALGDPFGGMFRQDDANTVGLTVAFHGGRLTQSDGTVLDVPDFDVTVAAGNNWIDLDEDGAAHVRTTSTPEAGHKCIWAAVVGTSEVVTATSQRDRRSALDFGAGGAGGDDASTTVKGIVKLSTAPADAANPIAVGDNDSRMTDSRTPTGGAGGVLSGTYPNPGFAVNMATQDELDGHINEAAPHTGHLNVDGSNALTADLDAGGYALTNLASGTNPTDAATLAQVDAVALGYKDLDNVRASSTTNLTLSGEQTIDSVACTDGDRVLLTGQTTQSENGIWLVRAGAWERPADFDNGDTPDAGTRVFVTFGAARKGTSWTLITTGGTVDTDPLTWTQTGAPGLGEANTASNVGVGTGPIYKGKSGVNLTFRSLLALSNRLTVAVDGDDVGLDVVEAQIDRNALGGDALEVAKGGTGLTGITEGALLVGGAGDTFDEIAPNTSETPMVLTQTDGGAPSWQVVSAPGYGGTSDNTFFNEITEFAFTTQSGLAYIVGDRVRLIPNDDPANWIEGPISSYAGTAMTVDVDSRNAAPEEGVGASFAGFRISIAGEPGAGDSEQAANKVKAGPVSGDPAAPDYRELVEADIPDLDAGKIASGTIDAARLGSGTADGTTYLRGDGAWHNPHPARGTVQATTGSLADEATEDLNIALGRGGFIYQLETDVPARVRLYTTAAARTADASRDGSTSPEPGDGVMMEVTTDVSNLVVTRDRPLPFYDIDGTLDGELPMAVTNLSGSTDTVTVTITRLTLEN